MCHADMPGDSRSSEWYLGWKRLGWEMKYAGICNPIFRCVHVQWISNVMMKPKNFGFLDFHPCPPEARKVRERERAFIGKCTPTCIICFQFCFGLVLFKFEMVYGIFSLMRRMRYACVGFTCHVAGARIHYQYLTYSYVLLYVLHA